MNSPLKPNMQYLKHIVLCLVLVGTIPAYSSEAWWNPAWSHRQKVTLQLPKKDHRKQDPVVLVRLTDAGVFAQAREDGSDLRWIAADGKTILASRIERYDPWLGEALLWLRVPGTDAATTEFHLYYGNPTSTAPADLQNFYPEETLAVYHFADAGKPPQDATSHGHHAAAVAPLSDGGIIGSALRLGRAESVPLGNGPALAWQPGAALTISLWIKAAPPGKLGTILRRGNGGNSVSLRLDDGIPTLDVTTDGARHSQRASGGVTPGTWHHLAWVAEGGKSRLYLDGIGSDPIASPLPSLDGPLELGSSEAGWSGEIDELRVDRAAWSEEEVKFTFASQGGGAQDWISLAAAETAGSGGGGKVLEHLQLFGDIAGNMMFDGWMAIGVCVIMIVVGWTVAIRKFLYLNRIEKGNRWFLERWRGLSSNLTALDEPLPGSPNREGDADSAWQEDSPLYHIYHIGSEEIRRRLHEPEKLHAGLSSRSIQAIRASLDAGLVEENHRLTHGLVYLTISVAGGPYVGLLGTVVGVMITFAIIAKSGEVNVNSIAPGIASALLATVVGLVVAIPALFIYSYLNSRIKSTVATMQVFIDEFVAKTAEYHHPRQEVPSSSEFHI